MKKMGISALVWLILTVATVLVLQDLSAGGISFVGLVWGVIVTAVAAFFRRNAPQQKEKT